MANQRIYRLRDVIARTGLSRSAIYELMSKNEFPSQIRLGPRTVGWVDREIDAWIDKQIKASRPTDLARK